jgi:hypothetical protein
MRISVGKSSSAELRRGKNHCEATSKNVRFRTTMTKGSFSQTFSHISERPISS